MPADETDSGGTGSAEAGPGETGPGEAGPAESSDVRAKFREALDRKNERTHRSDAAAGDRDKFHGEHGPAAQRRTFRRKTGG